MRFRFSMTCALGLAAALVAFDASHSYVHAQAPTDTAAARRRAAARRAAARRAAARRAAAARARSEQQIPTTGKEVPAQQTVRVDTVYQTRTDTVYRMRTDTVTVSRVDTVTNQLPPVYPKGRLGGFYWAVAAGTTVPRQELNTTFEPGWNVTGSLGWDVLGTPFGIRVDGAYDHFSERAPFAGLGGGGTGADPRILSLNGDVKLRLPIFGMETGGRASFYAVGGGTWFHYKNLYWAPANTRCCGPQVNTSQAEGDWHSKFGYNAGLGMTIGFGPSDLFLETRWTSIGSSRSFLPVVAGIMF